MTEPTQKQIDFAESIAEALDLELPAEFTKAAYSKFISEWKDDYYSGMREDDYWKNVR